MQQNQQAYEQPLEKHRLEDEDYSIDFDERMGTGESLASVVSISVIAGGGGVWVDYTSEFGVLGEVIDGNSAKFRLSAAAAGQQDSELEYFVRAIVTTSNGRKLVSIHQLLVSEQADPTAP